MTIKELIVENDTIERMLAFQGWVFGDDWHHPYYKSCRDISDFVKEFLSTEIPQETHDKFNQLVETMRKEYKKARNALE